MKERDEALKKIPPNVQEIIKDMKERVSKVNKEMTGFNAKLDDKVSTTKLKKDMKRKMDIEAFQKTFPKDMAPIDFLRGLIYESTHEVQENVKNMMQHWDGKLVQIRKDLDTKIIYKRMESFAEKFQVEHSFNE
jgi:Skp family chaperone for outer membrane proteins